MARFVIGHEAKAATLLGFYSELLGWPMDPVWHFDLEAVYSQG